MGDQGALLQDLGALDSLTVVITPPKEFVWHVLHPVNELVQHMIENFGDLDPAGLTNRQSYVQQEICNLTAVIKERSRAKEFRAEHERLVKQLVRVENILTASWH